MLRYLWLALFEYPYLPWGLLIIVCVIFATSRNSFLVNYSYGKRRQSELETHIEVCRLPTAYFANPTLTLTLRSSMPSDAGTRRP